ncbi:putative transcription factor interactor and regulator CCHC(Zn) family [Helianthus annuus]|nr:uncharacterized protein LOC110884125 [Helianthus annuus]XP_022036811.1 uncharacterized protein LOC110939563 [Helianthus annuus]KAJ0432107.1 putative transcription factor interactor and regulator CCHC(Zn) family [Helianthus annuus]KAJ0616524.1 putative transcription factor interactor and regulator CCHC(Zn) family [Helianthus annuus]
MTNLAKLEFMALDITGKNYLSWVLDAEIHLNANNLGETIKEGNKANTQDKAKAMIFLRHHIHEALKSEYLTIKDPLVLWTNLKERYDHQKTVILPRARYEWINLRLQDFKSISEYNSAMFRITSQLILCGENITDKEMLEKTFLTFHPSNVILQQQYRERGFTKYSELISCLLVAEQNNELLMKNHETRPVGATPIPEANVATYNGQSESYGRGRGYHRGRGRGHGRGRGQGRGRGRGNYHSVQFKNKGTHQKWHNNEHKSNEEKNKKKVGSSSNACYRCGSNNHWSKTCRTAKHLVELYQQSIKDKAKEIETNFTYEVANVDKDHNDATNLDYDDFLIEPTNLDSGDIVADTTQLDACNFPYI